MGWGSHPLLNTAASAFRVLFQLQLRWTYFLKVVIKTHVQFCVLTIFTQH